MRGLIWIIVLFAAAVGLAVAAGTYSGNVYIVAEQTMLRINLHAFILGLILSVVALYILIRLIAGILNIPGRLQRLGTKRKGRQASAHLNSAGLAFFEGKFQKAGQEVEKVLGNQEAGDNRILALMLGAHAADQMNDMELRDRYLKDIGILPTKQQLSRYLLLAESALNRRDYPEAERNLIAATQINPSLTRLVRLQLRYAFDHGNALDVLDKTDKLSKAGALNDYEAAQYQEWAYRRLLALASDPEGMKACMKRIPDNFKAGELCIEIAEKYDRLGMYKQAVKWVKQHYPQNRSTELLEPFMRSLQYLNSNEQKKLLDEADEWLKAHPDDEQLLRHLGEMSYQKQLWGKAQGYLEASLSVKPTVQARLALAKVFDETEQPAKAEEQRMLALEGMVHEEE